MKKVIVVACVIVMAGAAHAYAAPAVDTYIQRRYKAYKARRHGYPRPRKAMVWYGMNRLETFMYWFQRSIAERTLQIRW